MAKILVWTGAPWFRRSYPKTALNIARRLRDAGHEVAWFAFTGLQWGVVEYEGFRVFPNDRDDFGQTWLPFWYSYYTPDIILQHFDAWVLGGEAVRLSRLPIIWMPPVDHQPLPPPLKSSLEGARHTVAITRFAQESFREAGLPSTYIPHGVDLSVYHPGDKREARRRMEFPEECFLLGVVGSNKGPRKNLGNVLKAFSDFLKAVPQARKEALLFLHTYVLRDSSNPQGYDLQTMWHSLGIADRVKYTVPDFYQAIGFTEEEQASLYRSFDWLVSVPLGEGFNLPAIESLACGTPVIYSNFSATPEVVGPGGLPVEPVEYVPFELSSSWQAIPSTKQTTERMIQAYQDWRDGGQLAKELGVKGSQHVLANYDWEVVMPRWFQYLEEIQARVELGKREGIQLGQRKREIKRERAVA